MDTYRRTTVRRPRWWRSITGWAVVALLAGMAVLAWAQQHPTAAGLVLLAVLVAGNGVGVWWRRRRAAAAARRTTVRPSA